MNPAPVLRLRGVVHSNPVHNPVQPSPEVAPERDETGRIVRRGYPAREGYDKYDVTVLTEGGGFVTVVFRAEALEAVGGWMPSAGETVDLPVRGFVAWAGQEGNRFRVPGYSLAGDLCAAERAGESGRRVAAVS